MQPPRTSPKKQLGKSQRAPFAFLAYCVLFTGIFITIQLFLCGLCAYSKKLYVSDGRWLLGICATALIADILFYIRLKRARLDLYREEAELLYAGTILCLPLFQWIFHKEMIVDIFQMRGSYSYIGWVIVAAWICVLLFGLMTDVPNYKIRPDRNHWTVRLRKRFRMPTKKN